MAKGKLFMRGFLILAPALLAVLAAACPTPSFGWVQETEVSLALPDSAPNSTGINYYVDGANGSDSNLGTSPDQAWQTIQKAADTITAGDSCTVLSGDYNERVQITESGASGAPITYRAEGTVKTKGFTVYADYINLIGFEITDTDDDDEDGQGIYVEGSHCVIEDNYVHFATRGGILIFADPADAPSTSSCIIRNNRLYRNAVAGIEINGRNHLVEGNEISRTIQYHPQWADPPDWVDADGMRFFGTGHMIRKNYIHGITLDDPENVDPHIDCFQTWGPAYDIAFERNFCENLNEDMQGFMIEEQNAPVRDLIVRNNIIQTFSHLNAYDCENITIVHNTFISDLSFASQNQLGVDLHNSQNATIKNNIFYDIFSDHLGIDESSQPGLDVGYNNVYRSDGQPPEGSPSPHDLWNVNPMFVDAAADDFHLQSNSPCIDAGIDVGVTQDYDGNPRPQGAGYDIGAYEHAASVYPPHELIVDDTDPGFSTIFSQDIWQEYVEADGQNYGYTHYYNQMIGTGEDIATWSVSLPRPGQYEVYAWWYERSWNPADVPYTVNHLGGSTTVRVNQQTNGGQWNLLGTFAFESQGSVTVSDDTSSGQDIVADAIRFVYIWPYFVYLPVVMR